MKNEEIEIYDFFKTHKQLREMANEALKGNRGKSLALNLILWLSKLCFFASIVFLIIILLNFRNFEFNLILYIILFALSLLISIFTYGPLKVSQCKHSINMVNNTNPLFKDISYGFSNKYLRNVGYGITLVFIYLINIILLIVPFIGKYINYQISGFILAENDEIKVGEALKLSTLYSKGYKNKFFKLFFSFVPEFLLCLVTAFIYSLWLRPKFNSALCCYYYDIKS